MPLFFIGRESMSEHCRGSCLPPYKALFYLPVGWIYKRSKNLWLSGLTLLLMEKIRSRFSLRRFGWTRIALVRLIHQHYQSSPLGGVVAVIGLYSFDFGLINQVQLKTIAPCCSFILSTTLIPSNPQGVALSTWFAIQGNTPEIGLNFNSRAKAVFDLHSKATREFARGEFDCNHLARERYRYRSGTLSRSS
jgi:apolipoprotein N-acyltransferase